MRWYQLLGLLLVTSALASVVLAIRVSRIHRRAGIALAVVGTLLWAAAVVPFVGLLAFERVDVGDSAVFCEIPNNDSAYAPSHWSWLPPGEVCEFATGDVGPTSWRVPAALALLVTPALAFFVMWPRRFVRRPDGTSLEVRV